MAGIRNYTWPQGEDLIMSLIYKSGPVGSETPVDLTGYSVRMDIALTDGTRVYTFNSADIPDVDGSGTVDNNDEIEGTDTNPDTMQPLGADGVINIHVPRTVTLPGGEAYTYITATPPVLVFNYDVFVRDTHDKQKKILQGQITIEKSVTLWQ